MSDPVLLETADAVTISDHQRAMGDVLRHFHGLGYALKDCADPRRTGRSLKTLKMYARRAGLSFPDYVPRGRNKAGTITPLAQ
jgi:hypothetical protein